MTAAQVNTKRILEDPETFATSLMAILIDTYGVEFFEWEPETLQFQLSEDYGADVPSINYDKIWAAVVLLTTDTFYKSVECFNYTAKAFANSDVNFDAWDPADPAELMWCITEAHLLDPPKEGEKRDFSREIRSYIGVVLNEAGIWQVPALLKPYADMPAQPGDQADILFSDDPEMFEAFATHQKSTVQELEELMIVRLHALIQQLGSLPLQHGNTEAVKHLKLPSLPRSA